MFRFSVLRSLTSPLTIPQVTPELILPLTVWRHLCTAPLIIPWRLIILSVGVFHLAYVPQFSCLAIRKLLIKVIHVYLRRLTRSSLWRPHKSLFFLFPFLISETACLLFESEGCGYSLSKRRCYMSHKAKVRPPRLWLRSPGSRGADTHNSPVKMLLRLFSSGSSGTFSLQKVASPPLCSTPIYKVKRKNLFYGVLSCFWCECNAGEERNLMNF